MKLFNWIINKFKHKHECKHDFEIIKHGDIYNEISIDDIKKIIEDILNIPTIPADEMYIGDNGIETKYNENKLNEFTNELANIIKTGLSSHPIGYYVIFRCKNCNYLNVNKIYFK